MNKNILIPLFFILLVLTLIYNIRTSNEKIDNFFALHQKVSDIHATNKNFDIFILNNMKYKNFDYIQNNIESLKNDLAFISTNRLFNELNNQTLKKLFYQLKQDMDKKINYINKIISKTAVLNNSFRYMQKVQKNLNNQELIFIYTQIVGLNYDFEIDLNVLNEKIYKFKIANESEEIFISHSKVILRYFYQLKELRNKVTTLKVNEKLSIFEQDFYQYSTNIIRELKDVIWLLTMVIFLSLVVFFYNNHMLRKKQTELNRFKKAVENSDNIIVITDKNKKIKYVNEAFEKTTGYSLKEVIGQTPSILKSFQKPESFYEELNETIHAGKKWKGEFINKNKNGEITFEKAAISPIFNEKGEIEEYLAIKLDITKEKETDNLLREKEKLLAQQSKMVAMREMLESIAHQWRQPLSTISTAASGITLNKEYDNLSDDKLEEYMSVIVDNTQYLSKTIDNFKNYFNTKNECTSFDVTTTMNKVLELLGYRLNEMKTEVILKSDKVVLEGLENEFIQVMINIINNSLEAFSHTKLDHKFIFVDIFKASNKAVIRIKDNAGGVPEDLIEHVFEPYFTTKHQLTGTGMGLFMSYEIITDHFNGDITIENCDYQYHQEKQRGTQIIMQVPLSSINL